MVSDEYGKESMSPKLLKAFLPNRTRPTRILRGPFRGAVIVTNPRNSMRKVFGLYERELNFFLDRALPLVTRVLDVGANDGYFTLGCAAAFRRLGKKACEIIAFEPQQNHVYTLRQSINQKLTGETRINIFQTLVGSKDGPGTTTLDAVRWKVGAPHSRDHTLVKIDVEGAEMDVLKGAMSWLNSTNYFVIEVHQESFLDSIPRLFETRGLSLTKVDQRPMRLLGPELRSKENWWLVSKY